jgi:hypothetical protein
MPAVAMALFMTEIPLVMKTIVVLLILIVSAYILARRKSIPNGGMQ